MSLASEAPQLVDASSGLQSSAWLLVVLPVLSSAVLLLGGRRTDRWGHVLGTLVPIVLFAYTVLLFFQLQGLDPGERSRNLNLWSWIFAGDLRIDMGLLLDPLSITFALLITGVGSLILVYSNGYMEHDPDRRRFFAYMNLFIAAMLLLVLGNNFVVLYFGWEGVGLASYLLIAWYSDRPAAATAAKKAFIMNRVGDCGLIIAIFLMFKTFGTVSFAGVFGSIGNASVGIATALALLLLLGACGKSGQVPLQAWLPDAMEGPTPVSALIHAATMVTAGVYLIVRAHPIYDATEAGRTVVTVVGAVTLLFGCIVGCAYDDIKKVLAYSTVSQIGYMFLAVGLGGAAYALALIHLLAHGFFKAGMFLGAGSVMHGMHDQVDIRRFGGLWKYMRITWATFAVGWLAILGMFPFSGFFSKDPIIEAAFDRPGWQGWALGIIAFAGAALTAFYMTRLFILTFHGPKRWTEGQHPHESPPSMTIPLILLAVGSLGAGYLIKTPVKDWLDPTVFGLPANAEFGEPGVHVGHALVMWGTLGIVVLSALLAYGLFRRGTALTEQPAGPIVVAARKNLYGDAVNEVVFEKPGKYLTRALVYFDNKGIDGLVNGLAALVGGGSGRLRRLQTGFVRSYALSMLGGAVLVALAFLVVRIG